MKLHFLRLSLFSCIVCSVLSVQAQQTLDSASFYSEEHTYVNPVLPGDHPDPTLLKVGDDFYHCGSSFHFNPYLPVYHSKDLVHWEIIGRVLTPEMSGFVTDRPSGGVWQGAITYFYGSYWIYFSANGQWFSKASNPAGPWTTPVQVQTNPTTGNLGYDNSIFVDDDGKPYMVIKNGQKVNRLQALGRDGQLTDTVMNMDWINANLQYSWAEGPVMAKRNGIYYYFPAGDVSGGQYAIKGTALTADSTKWTRLGEFFKPITDPKTGFRRPNHIAAPIELQDGTWWTIGQSYERYDGNDWSGLGRQTGLYQVTWENERPWGAAPTTLPSLAPNLPKGGIHWRAAVSDYFGSDSLGAWWHFLNKKAIKNYSLTARKGWVRLTPDSGRTHLMQKETDHFYTAYTKVDFDALDTTAKAGLYLSNGNQTVNVRLYAGYSNGKKEIVFTHDTYTFRAPYEEGTVAWLKLSRKQHDLTATFSLDGNIWTTLGTVNAQKLDRAQPNYNSWVGTSVGLFAEGKFADFDFFVCKDGESPMPAIGYSNYYGVVQAGDSATLAVTNVGERGGWFMISGVEFGENGHPSNNIDLQVSSAASATLEVYIDGLTKNGKLLAKVVAPANSQMKSVSAKIPATTGQHDVYVRFLPGVARVANVYSLKLSK